MAGRTTCVVGWPSGEWSVDDLAALPEDGMCRELVDGLLLVTPTPSVPHQAASMGLSYALRGACPPSLQVLAAPLDYQPDRRHRVQPDLLVARRVDIPLAGPLLLAPLLVVEILHRGTRTKDLMLKRTVYEEFGIPSYWIFDPDVPSLSVSTLGRGVYRQVSMAVGADEIAVETPFPVHLCPDALLAG
jgi:Uma2 family endonuclease